MKRIELWRSEIDFEIAEIDGDSVMFRYYEIATPEDYPDMPAGEVFERSGFSVSLDSIRKVAKAAEE